MSEVHDRAVRGALNHVAARWFVEPRFEKDYRNYFAHMSDINRAHVLMLLHQGLIGEEPASALLDAVHETSALPLEDLDLQGVEDLYFAMEREILTRAGSEGGRIHIGRSRNDISATIAAMEVRERCNSLSSDLLALISELISVGSKHVTTVMPGYTHLRPAQPMTFAYWLSGVASALQRDYERMRSAYDRQSACPMGAVAFAGTSHAIDRSYTARLLGFSGPTAHALDAVASRDGILEFLSSLSIMATTLARALQDLYIWTSAEFGFLSLGSDATGASSVMPQKQNPILLERCRAKAARLLGAFTVATVALKGSGFMHSHDSSVDATGEAWPAAEDASALLQTLRVLVSGLVVHESRMLERSAADYGTSTEIADYLVRQYDIPFRLAYRVVNSAVALLRDCAKPDGIENWHSSLIKAAANHGVRIGDIDGSRLAELLDPTASTNRKTSLGSPNPSLVSRSLERLQEWHGNRREEVTHEIARLEQARTSLHEMAADACTRSKH